MVRRTPADCWVAGFLGTGKNDQVAQRSILYIDSAYTLRIVRSNRHESFFHARHASGYFDRVYSVHPLADLVDGPSHRIDLSRLSPRHLVIEGKVELLPWPRALKPLNFIISQLKLYRFLSNVVRRRGIVMIMAADPYYSALLGLALARRHKRPFGIRIGANADENYRSSGALAMPRLFPTYAMQRMVQQFILKRADLVTGINRNNLEFGIANGARGVTRVVPISSNVADVHRIPPDERGDPLALLKSLGLPTDAPMLLYLGRLLALKHPDDAIRAMAFNIRRNPRVVGLVVGAGPVEPSLRDLARELGVSGSIHFLGELTQEALGLLIPRCIMLSPSPGQMAVLEGALGGAPIVAYDRDFQSEFIEDGVNGFKVPSRDVEAMARRAELLINDPALARRVSAGARRTGLEQVDPLRVKEIEWEAFNSVMPEPLRRTIGVPEA